MTNPIELIGQGIENGDWQKVADGYRKMTGRKVRVPADLKKIEYDTLLWTIKGEIDRCLGLEREDGGSEDAEAEAEADEEEVSLEPEPEPPRGGNELDKFRVRHDPPKKDQEDGRVQSKALQFRVEPTNRFVDDRSLVKNQIKDSRAFSRKKKPEPRRPPVKLVKVTCCRCQASEEVHPNLVPQRLDKADERPRYICNQCVVGNRGSS